MKNSVQAPDEEKCAFSGIEKEMILYGQDYSVHTQDP